LYEQYWGLTGLPYQNLPDPSIFFPSGQHKRALGLLRYAVQYDKGAALPTLTRTFLLQLPDDRHDAGVLTNPALPPRDFLEEITLQLGIAGLPQLDQRIAIRCHLGPLDADEAAQYIALRIKKAGASRGVFSDEALRLLHQAARGIPRSLNTLCDLCLLEGFAAKAMSVDGALVRRVLQASR
jgi:type II secretory pathway predicted ATPase ExeA